MVVAPEQCVAARPARMHTSNEEWSKINGELVRLNVVVEIDLSDKTRCGLVSRPRLGIRCGGE